jgi:hypothetical protein
MVFYFYVISYTEVKKGSKKTNADDVNVWTGQTICNMNPVILSFYDVFPLKKSCPFAISSHADVSNLPFLLGIIYGLFMAIFIQLNLFLSCTSKI